VYFTHAVCLYAVRLFLVLTVLYVLPTLRFYFSYYLKRFVKRLLNSSPNWSTRWMPCVLRKMRQDFSVLYSWLNLRRQNNPFDPFFWSGPSVGSRYAETGQLFKILKQTYPEGIVWLHSFCTEPLKPLVLHRPL